MGHTGEEEAAADVLSCQTEAASEVAAPKKKLAKKLRQTMLGTFCCSGVGNFFAIANFVL